MEVGKALSFVFEDEEWAAKFLLGAVIMLVPIFGWLVFMGYVIALIRNVVADDPRPLPAWVDIGDYFMDGLMYWVATLVYAIPIFLLICPLVVIWIPPILAQENQDLTGILSGVSGLLTVGLGCLMALYGILLRLLRPVLQIRYAERGEIGACLRFGEVFRFLFANIGPIIIAELLAWAAGMIIGSIVGTMGAVLALVPVCGQILVMLVGLVMLPVGAWLMVFSGHLYGQIARRAGVIAFPS